MVDIVGYSEAEGYIECVGGNPKSGTFWKMTEKGLEFIAKEE